MRHATRRRMKSPVFPVVAVVVASVVTIVAERTASACLPPMGDPCTLGFAPAVGKGVPANAPAIIVVRPQAYQESGLRSAELIGPDGTPVLVTTEQPVEGGPITLTPQAALTPGRHRIVATAAQPSSCAGPVIEADAGVPDKKLYRHESTFVVGSSRPMPSAAGTITLGERRLLSAQESPSQLFSYPVSVAVAPEMEPYLSIARWTIEVDGASRGDGGFGGEPSFALSLGCNGGGLEGSCNSGRAETPGLHKVRVVARLGGSEAPIATNEIDVDLACDGGSGSSASDPSADSGSGCNVTRRSAGGGALLLGLAAVIARLRRRSR